MSGGAFGSRALASQSLGIMFVCFNAVFYIRVFKLLYINLEIKIKHPTAIDLSFYLMTYFKKEKKTFLNDSGIN